MTTNNIVPITLPPAVSGIVPRTKAQLRRSLLRSRLVLRKALAFGRRLIDIVVALMAIIVSSPILLTAAIAIKLTSKGPIFYTQERLGQYGRKFRMFKLRTMIVAADQLKTQLASTEKNAMDGVRFKIRHDPRITPVGRVLRKFSIDEFPQFLNVLLGDMTLIGPRPPVWREVSLYDAVALRRLEVRPGLTCLWQIQGRSDLSFEKQIELDLQYIDQTTPLEEWKILLQTPKAVLTGKGAY